MGKERISRIVVLVFLIIGFSVLFYRVRFPYSISEKDVKAIYCDYWDGNGEHKIPISDSDKKLILPEISKMKNSNVEGQIGTLSYKFVIELTSGNKFTFYESSKNFVTLQLEKGNFYRNIKAPKTAEFIKNFISKNNINPY